ncbi:MAG: UDP-glucose--hexose-1-phosphate uridylyltransferase [Acidobacteria bacterium]|nr:UDP-glucose--hexose-1-phosphate uridylyltransferase [Acidobacteriota bacterium]
MIQDQQIFLQPHRRWNPLTREWVLVSPHRARRPWLGQVEKKAAPVRASYDPSCYLCPGNERAAGHRNPAYDATFVFDNDFAALLPENEGAEWNRDDLLMAKGERGICRVVCFSPDHGLSVPSLPPDAMERVVDVWTDEYNTLGAFDWVQSVQIFENRGEMMGASNPHPHCQIWANASVPVELSKELAAQAAYRGSRGRCLLCDVLALELDARERIVEENEAFVALVPFWAVWPFETLVVARRHFGAIPDMSASERRQLAGLMQALARRYDSLFDVAFPYSMGFHQRPTDGQSHPSFHFHAHYYPPLLRSAEVRKFMVGYEMLANPQRDITPESAAERLRSLQV